MSEKEFDMTFRNFVKTVVDSIGEAAITEYDTTVLTVDRSGGLRFELLLPDKAGVAADHEALCLAFGRTLATRGMRVASVFVAEQEYDSARTPYITVTGADTDGHTRATRLKAMVAADGALNVAPPESSEHGFTTPFEFSSASRILAGFVSI